MKKMGLLLSLLLSLFSFAQEFTREFPEEKLTSQVTKERSPNSDAVIILKEQSLNVTDNQGDEETSKVLIVKLLTEAGVSRYGSFEYEYNEPFGDYLPCGFSVCARVKKPDGKIEVLDKNEIKKIVSLRWNDGSPMRRKVLFKIPNLSVGDILQIEYKLSESYGAENGGTFFYNDLDYVIVSNVYLTLPANTEFSVYSFPEDKIGAPVIRQMSKKFGAGKTYFWSVNNLNSIPYEPYSFPFEDQSCMTAFTVHFDWTYIDQAKDWRGLGKFLFEKVIDKGGVSRGEIEDLNLPREIKNISINKTDSLYTLLKKTFKVLDYNSIYPKKSFSDLLKLKKGKATDIAFLMYKILEKWGFPGKVALIRDKRKGSFEEGVPCLEWFNRIGVLVKIDGKEKLYDFDPSVPNKFENPWFLNAVKVFVVGKGEAYIQDINFESAPDNNQIIEFHNLNISPELSVTDSIILSYSGANAQNLRYNYYEKEEQEIRDNLRRKLSSSCLSYIDSITVNDIFENNELIFTAKGKASASVQAVDSFLVVRIKNEIFKNLRDKLFTTRRTGHILFDSPFNYKFKCDIKIPNGYTLKNQMGERELNTSFKGKFTLRYTNADPFLKVDGLLNIPDNAITQEKYTELMGLLDGAIKAIEKDIVLKKM
jgi:hypothetical protein